MTEFEINVFTNTKAMYDPETGIVTIYTGDVTTGLTTSQVVTLGGWEKIKTRVKDGSLTALTPTPVYVPPIPVVPEVPVKTVKEIVYEAPEAKLDEYITWGGTYAYWAKIRKAEIEAAKPPPAPPPPPAYVYKVLPKPTPEFKGRGLELYKELDQALLKKDIAATLRILREGLTIEMSPIVFTAAILLITKIVAIIASVIGSIGFAEFLMEEAIQTIDFGITAASREKNWELEAKALAKKKELLDRNAWEQIIGAIPLVNVVAAAWKYFEAARIKYEIDFELWKTKALATGVNPNVSLSKAAAAIEAGEDPSQYLPTAMSEEIPEIITGKVTGVVDGDTIEVTDTFGRLFRVRMIGIDAPEFITIAGKKATTYLTDMISGKTVTVKVDPNNKLDPYKRVLGVVFLNGKDINKEMLSSGNANYYVIGSSKYYSDDEYKAAVRKTGKLAITSKPTYCKIYVEGKDTGLLTAQTLDLTEGIYIVGCAKEGYRAEAKTVEVKAAETIEIRFELTASALGEEETIEEVTEELLPVEVPTKFKIYITSTPANAKLYIDDYYTHHWTPSNEKELSDVLNLLAVGKHTIKVTKAGMQAEKEITVTEGDNGVIHLDLETVGLPPVEVKPPVEVIEIPELPPKAEWTDDMKLMAKVILTEIEGLTEGIKTLSAAELKELKIKYGVE